MTEPTASARPDPSAPGGTATEGIPGPLDARPGLPMLVRFAPYLVISALHLVAIAAERDALAAESKYWLMPLLAVSVLLSVRLRPPAGRAVPLLLAAGLAASWAGDSVLGFDGGTMFVIGLAAFLLAHLAYIAAFVVLARRRAAPRPPRWTAVYALAVLALAVLLWPGLGPLGAPVVVYGAVLGLMAATAARISPVLGAGGALFLVSDSLLALGRFADWYDFPLNGLAVMLSYTAAQGLIAIGVARAAARD